MSRKITTNDFIENAKKIHGDKYNYHNTIYTSAKNHVIIECKIHGNFFQTPNDHLNKRGCKKCGDKRKNLNRILGNNKFIEASNLIHNHKYDYSLVNYINNRTNVSIICREHGIFNQLPDNHLKGCGCPQCFNKSKAEKYIQKILIENQIEFNREFKFNSCFGLSNKKLPFDFYLPKYKCCIEYDGEQHFNEFRFRNAKKSLESVKFRDSIKNKFCQENGINLIRVPYTEFKNINTILQSEFERGFDRSLDLSKLLHDKINSKVCMVNG